MNSSHKINSIIYLNAIPIAERELSMQSLESVIIFHKFNKQMNTQKLKRKKKKEAMKEILRISFLLKIVKKY